MSAAAFFQAWPPIPYTADVTALGAAAGVDGGLLALSALERSPLARVLLTGLPALGGFQAAYLGMHRFLLANRVSTAETCSNCRAGGNEMVNAGRELLAGRPALIAGV